MLERLYALEQFGIKLGLANIAALCDALGHPERSFASLHVAGTNGKGSVTAMAHAALRAAGVHAARYTSPHLVALNERFVIDDDPVGDADLEAAATLVLDVSDDLVARGTLPAPPTFFEATTATAFELFRRSGVEAAVLEVGLGGRFDATNVVQPVATAITSIGFDHRQHLGDTLEQIAYEKAGIVKPGIPVVVGSLGGEARRIIESVAAERGAPLVSADAARSRELQVVKQLDGDCLVVEVTTPEGHYGPLTLGLRGEHQIDNAMVAIRLLETARDAGLRVTEAAIERGLSNVAWPARLEVLAFPGGRRMVIDAAHNADGAAALARFLERHHAERPPLVFAAMRDKDVTSMLQPLLSAVGPVVVTTAPSPRTSPPEDLAAVVHTLDPMRPVAVERDPLRAVELAWAHGNTICVAGSVFLAGAVRGALHGRAIVGSSR